MSEPLTPWWVDAVVYEIYLRSFADSDGDGVGDLGGIVARLDHVSRLGADAVWVTPFFPSPGHDHGYDVSNFLDVDPTFGDLAGFRRLVAAAHHRGLRVLVDVVPNHTSHEHPWFRAALTEGRNGGKYRDYYLWVDPVDDGGPPNNWLSNFGGPAWTFDEASGQYYQHSYLPEQPDLNWRNPRVRLEWTNILHHWLKLGADGFRIDVAHNLLKHPDLLDNPVRTDIDLGCVPAGRVLASRRLKRIHDVDQDDVVDIYAALRDDLALTMAGEPPLLLGETVLEDPARVARYIGAGRLDCAMWFGTERVTFTADDVARALRAADLPTAGVFGWFLSNHDRSRPATRLGSADRALSVASAVLAMPGPYLLYQGEELGALDLDVSAEDSRDPIAVRAGEPTMGRDRARAPMPWADAPGRGFSAVKPWLAHAPLPATGSVATQEQEPSSHLHRWRALLTMWRDVRANLPRAVDVTVDGQLLAVRRGSLRTVVNFASEALPMSDMDTAQVGWRSLPGNPVGTIRAGEAVWLHDQEKEYS